MSSVEEVLRIVQASELDLDALEAALEGLSHHERVQATRKWGGKEQSRIFAAAEGRKPVTLEQLVPSPRPFQEVVHTGKNTVFPMVDRFEKRFCRVEGKSDLLHGYNESWYRFAVSPGYYVAYEDADTGEVVIDYTQAPDSKPSSWPKVRPNWYLLGIFIYHGMLDRLRYVSDHVTIGRAIKGKPMNQYFTLVRED